MLNQVLNLTWHTAVFRTMNEARRLEPKRSVNGAMWELMTAGYSNIITVGIRRLVDNHPNSDSVLNVIGRIERRPELLTREFYVCHDGLPFDDEAAFDAHLEATKSDPGPRWLETTGPAAFDIAARMHEAFDAVCGYPDERKRKDQIDAAFFATLRAQLKHPSIRKVCTMVDKTVAHAERIPASAPAVPVATYNDVDEALGIIVRVCQFVSWNILGEGGFSSVVATPQFDVLEHLDQPWCLPETLPALLDYWHTLARSMDDWASTSDDVLLPKKPT